METNICKICGKEFPIRPHQWNKFYCSLECQKKASKTYQYSYSQARDYNQCPICGGRKHKKSELCQECRYKAKKPKIGKTIRSGTDFGYTKVYQPDHPRADCTGYMLEHIFVWEQAHGKPLPKGWIIHHLNGIKDDNKVANLLAMPDRKHRRILMAKAKRIQELEALLNSQHQLL